MDDQAPQREGGLTALTISCTLKPSPAQSSSEKLSGQISSLLEERDVATSHVRAVDHDILPGVDKDMGRGTSGRRFARRCSPPTSSCS